MSQMSESELKSILAAEIADSLAHLGGELSEQRRKALRYYLGEPFGNEQEGRSKVVSTDVADVVEWILPSLLKIFTGGDEVVRFEPTGPEDEEVAKQATEYVNWIFSRDNSGFLTFYTLFKDALLQKNGIAKVWWEEGETASRFPLSSSNPITHLRRFGGRTSFGAVMVRRLLDTDSLTGMSEYHHYDSLTDRTVIETVQDAAPTLERNKVLQNHDDQGWLPSRDLRRAATIPDIIVLKWRNEYGIDVFNRDHWPAVKKLLNDPEWRYLRTAPGTL